MTKPRILLADDHPEMLDTLRVLLNELGEVVGTVTDGQALVEAAQRLEPDLIFSDISMPGLNGFDATRTLQICAPQSKVIILTVHREPVYVSLALDAGARGYLLKRSAVAELPQAVRHVLAGDRYIGQGVSEERASADQDLVSMRRPELQAPASCFPPLWEGTEFGGAGDAGLSGGEKETVMEGRDFQEEDRDEVSGRRIPMAQRNDVSGEAGSRSQKTEVPMETQTVQETSTVTPAAVCAHERLIDDVLTRDGKRTGKVRCLECSVVFADPYRGVN